MAIVVTYKNWKTARKGMLRRGLFAWQPSYWRVNVNNRGESLAPKKHFDIDSGVVTRWVNKPEVTVTYRYFNMNNEPKQRKKAV